MVEIIAARGSIALLSLVPNLKSWEKGLSLLDFKSSPNLTDRSLCLGMIGEIVG